MPSYMIIETKEVFDPQKYGEYIRQVSPMVEGFGGRYLARGGNIAHIIGDWHPNRMVIIEFPTRAQFDTWFYSPQYAAIKHLREEGAKTNAILVEGIGDAPDPTPAVNP